MPAPGVRGLGGAPESRTEARSAGLGTRILVVEASRFLRGVMGFHVFRVPESHVFRVPWHFAGVRFVERGGVGGPKGIGLLRCVGDGEGSSWLESAANLLS